MKALGAADFQAGTNAEDTRPSFASLWRSPFRNASLSFTARPKGNLPCLDVLRVLAILLVLSLHVGEGFPERIRNLPFVFYGWSGVDLFFVLSGFLIGTQLWKELYRRGSIDVANFVLRRGFRIWPLYFSFIVVVGGSALVSGKPVRDFIVDIACVSNYFHHKISGGWSLSTEEQFYIIVPLLLYILSRVVRPSLLGLLPLLWLLALPLLRWHKIHGAPASAIQSLTYFPFHTHSDGLAVGLFTAWLVVRWPGLLKAPLWKGISVLAAGLMLGLVLRGLNQGLFRFSSLAIIYGSLLFFLLQIRLPRVFEWSGFYVISRLSYGMYLNQFHVIDLTSQLNLAGYGRIGFAVAWLLNLAGSIAVAYVTFALIELPFLRMRELWLVRVRNTAAGSTSKLQERLEVTSQPEYSFSTPATAD